MKISLKITGLEITIDTDDAPGAISAQSIVDAISPLIVEPDLQAPAEPSAVEPPAQPAPAPLPPAAVHTNGHYATGTRKSPPVAPTTNNPVKRRVLPFEEFDRLVRAEMKRLQVAGTMPGHGVWDEHRHMPLPTLQAVISRYGCKSTTELASRLGLMPPLTTKLPGEREQVMA